MKIINKTDKLKIKRAEESDIKNITRLMELVSSSVTQKDWFVADDESMISKHISEEGFTLLALINGEPVGFMIVRMPGMAEDHLGYDLGLDETKLKQSAHMESVGILPEARGKGLQQILLKCAEEHLTEMGFRYFLATVHPDNASSLKSFTNLEYEIKKKVFKYGGKERLILYKDYSVKRSLTTCACTKVVKRTWDTPEYEHKSGTIVTRYANIWMGLWECEARNNPCNTD